MNKVIFMIFFIIPISLFAQTPNVSFDYDNDGNMKLRKNRQTKQYLKIILEIRKWYYIRIPPTVYSNYQYPN